MRRALASVGVATLMLAGTAGTAVAQQGDDQGSNRDDRGGFNDQCRDRGGIPVNLDGILKLCLLPSDNDRNGGGLLDGIGLF